MNIANIQFPVFNPYEKSTLEIYVSGCTNGCKGCHNSELQDFNFGESLNMDKLVEYMKERQSFYDIISISGGDLLCQTNYEALEFINYLRLNFPNKEYWLFTGKTRKGIPKWCYDYFDVIKYGPYKKEFKQEGFPVSTNQKVIYKGLDY